MGKMGRVIAYAQLGGFGTRLSPLLHQPGLNSLKILSSSGRNLKPFNHNSYYAVPKPVLPYFGIALSEPLLRNAVKAGVKDIRGTIHNQPDIVIDYYRGRDLGHGTYMTKFLYEHKPLDTSGGIVRDVIAGIKNGTIEPSDIILVLGGDIRTDANIEEFLAEHESSKSDVSILLSEVERNEMHRFGAAIRQGDSTPELGKVMVKIGNKEKEQSVYGKLSLSQERMARIVKFLEKSPKLDPATIINPAGLVIEDVLKEHGVGAFAPTNLQNGSVYAIRAELMAQLAPIVYNIPPEASSYDWENTYDINISGPSKFSDFGGNWFMSFTGSAPWPEVNPKSGIQEMQNRILADLKKAPPQVFGYKHKGSWSDDGTIESVLKGHIDILHELIEKGKESSWPITWDRVKGDYPNGIITMSSFNLNEVTVIPPIFIGYDVRILPGAKIGPFAIVGSGWEVAGDISHSVLFSKKKVDEEIEGSRGWKRFVVPSGMKIISSIIGSGFEIQKIDSEGTIVLDSNIVDNKVVVSNGSENVISDLGI